MVIFNLFIFLFCLYMFAASTHGTLKNYKEEIELSNSEVVRERMLAKMYVRQSVLWCAFWGSLTILALNTLVK